MNKTKEPKIISKLTIRNIEPTTKQKQEEILKSLKDLLKDRTDIKNVYISHYDFIYIVMTFNKYIENEKEFLSIIENINNNISVIMSYTYKDNKENHKPLYKYSYKPIQKPIFINDD